MRLFYSNAECTSGQLVIASPDSQYKILHFHHGGMDKLAQLFEQWNAIKGKSVKDVWDPMIMAILSISISRVRPVPIPTDIFSSADRK